MVSSKATSTYNKLPLMYLALAAQRNNYALYLTSATSDRRLMDRLACRPRRPQY